MIRIALVEDEAEVRAQLQGYMQQMDMSRQKGAADKIRKGGGVLAM